MSLDFSQCMGIAVGVLTILVTVLLGWQIWKSVEYDKAFRRINDLEYISKGYLEFAIGMSFLKTNPEHTLMQCVFALERLNCASKAEYDNIFMAMKSIADAEDKVSMDKNDIKRLVRALRNSHQGEADDLIEKFSDWPLKD